MKHLLFISICWLLAGAPTTLSAQSIRKDYREFTAQELTDFKAVILEMAPADIPYDFNYYYANNYCSNINTTWGGICHPAQYG
ncbi:MAG: hypothetical protein IT269_09400, partial [Saprospiraceae bacterium]|nr:hypothetical protein [Saprospiraceae bacterium]